MATMKDIAREAGVSHGTVSNVLNKTGKVSIEKIRLVEEAAKRLGYVPNTQAQMLRQGAPTSVAIIIPSLREEAYLDLYTAIQSSISQYDYDTTIHTTDDISSKEESVLEKLHISSIAAVITVSCLSSECCERYQDFPCPVVYVDRKPTTLRDCDSFFSFDFQKVGKELADHISVNGWKNVAFFSSPSSMHQATTLLSSMKENITDSTVTIRGYSSDYNLALNKAFDIVQSGIDYDAIITPSSVRAESVFSALQLSHCKRTPRIITLGSARTFHTNTISTYELDYNQLGAKLSQSLIQNFQNKEPLPTEAILQAKGFPYQFHSTKKMPGESLTMLTLENPSTLALRKLLPMFEAVSGIQVKLICIPYDDLHAQIDMLSPNFSYDLIRMDVARFDSLGEKTYLPLKEVGITKDILPQKLIQSAYDNYSQINGTIYALPFDPSIQLFLYRTDLFNDAKIRRAYYERYHEQLTVPTSIAQYLRVAEFFTQKSNPDSPTKYGATITNGSAASAASDFLPYYLEKVSSICDESGSIRIDTAEFVEAMQQYKQMEQYACQQQWWNDSIRQFSDGVAATTVIYSNYAANIISSKHSNVVGRVGAAVAPGGKPLLGGGVIGISKYSKKQEACKQFFNWYYSPEIASLLVRLGGTSPLVDAYNDFRNFSIFPWLSASKDSFGLGIRGVSNKEVPGFSIQKYEFAIGTAVKNLLNGIMSPTEAATMAHAMYHSN